MIRQTGTVIKNRSRLILILGLLSAIGPFSIDMYLPAFPVIAANLHTTPELISYSLSSYFIGICLGQMLIGPLLDRYGRKRPLYGGLIIYILSSIGCAFAPTIEILIALRLFQAAGGCVGIVAPRAIIRDLFPVEENAKIFSLLILILGVSPIIAPTAGGYISAHFGWHIIFVLLSIITSIILIAVFFYLPESKQPDPSFSLKPKPILASFQKVITHPQFYTYSLTGAMASAGLYAYLAGSPFVFMELYHVTGQHYGWIFAIIAAGLITSSQLNNIILRKYTSSQIIRVTLSAQCIVGVVLVLGTLNSWLGLYGTIACIFFYLCCQGFSFPNSSALSMAPFSKEAGSASALMGSIQMALGAGASALVGFLTDGTAIPMTVVMAGCSLTAVIILMMGRKAIYRCKNEDVEEQTLEMIENY
ncbi:MAG TPA: multidrug effflux MFS transporter [Flavitalea sp.]|nr:multidrug effflux MFS transporter [Flavitalea sp.]